MVSSIPKFSSTVVGALACQKDSYLRHLKTTVVGCQQYIAEETGGKKSKKKAPTGEEAETKYAVELEDTVLFPLGGGQPFDLGFISYKAEDVLKRVPVLSVIREGLIAKHITKEPIKIGTEVDLDVDWDRRFDHMQQHTGQHLLSAILDRYDLNTLSWAMTDMINYIELPRKVTEEEIEEVSQKVNEAILNNYPVNVEVPHKDAVDKSKMPDDYDIEKGVLRVIHIGNLDSNACCGTHLSSTSEIGAIVLLHQSPVRGTNSKLYFLAGDRVRQYAKYSHGILKSLNSFLSCQTDEIFEKVELLNNSYQKASKRESNLMKEISAYKIKEIKSDFETLDFTFSYKPEAKLEFISQIFKDLSAYLKEHDSKTLVLLCGEGSEGGSLIVTGDKTETVSKALTKLIKNLKGGGKGKYQGKITSFEKGEERRVVSYLEALKAGDELTLEKLTI